VFTPFHKPPYPYLYGRSVDETTTTATVEVEWLHELLMDLRVVKKPIPAILMNCDNQTVIIKVNSSKDNMK
jgi:hypothetical protein